MGTLLDHQAGQSEEAQSSLRRDLDAFLERDRDRELFDLPPVAAPSPESPAPTPSPARDRMADPLPGWSPASLGANTWGSRWRGDTRTLPDDLVGCAIEVTTRKGDSWITRVVEVLEWTADFVLVRVSGKP